MGIDFPRNSIDVIILAIGLFAFIYFVLKGFVDLSNYPLWILLVVPFFLLLLVFGYVFDRTPIVPLLMEVKLLVYLLISFFIFKGKFSPNAINFYQYGSALSIILICETFFRSLASGSLVRPVGSGEVNYDAALILVALVFCFDNRVAFKRYAPLLMIGIILTFSRTTLLAACMIFFLSNLISFKYRLFVIILAMSAIFGSFAIRGLEINSLESMDRYWMWKSGIAYLQENRFGSSISFSPGAPVKLDVPVFIEELWTNQQEALGLNDVYPFHLHAFWLRAAVSWGWLPIFILLFFYIYKYFSPKTSFSAKAYILSTIVLGLTMGLFYLGNVSIPYLLAGYILLSNGGSQIQSRR